MAEELFAKLREFDSLSKTKLRHLAEIESQNERLTLLNKKREGNLEKIAELKKSLTTHQSSLAELEAQIKSHSEQRQRILDYGGDEAKAQEFAEKISSAEEKGLEILGEIELAETELQDARGFDQGIGKTIEEISGEVEEIVALEKMSIATIDQRLAGLQEDLPADFRDRLNRVLAKKLAHGPFTRIENGACFMCRFKISRVEESEIDMQKQLKNCPQCMRLFIPYGT